MDRTATGMKKVKIDIEKVRQAASSHYENLRTDQKDAARSLFQAIDTDKNGYLSFQEFRTYLTDAGFETENCYWLFRELDKDNNGFLDFMELVTFFYFLLQRDEYKHQLSRASTVGISREVGNGRPKAGANDRGLSPEWQENVHLFASGIQIGQLGFQIGQFLVQTGCTIV